jgi:hypothetical protein
VARFIHIYKLNISDSGTNYKPRKQTSAGERRRLDRESALRTGAARGEAEIVHVRLGAFGRHGLEEHPPELLVGHGDLGTVRQYAMQPIVTC